MNKYNKIQFFNLEIEEYFDNNIPLTVTKIITLAKSCKISTNDIVVTKFWFKVLGDGNE